MNDAAAHEIILENGPPGPMAPAPPVAVPAAAAPQTMGHYAAARRRAVTFSHWARMFFSMLWQRMNEDRTFEQSAALAYNTLFSLLPILVLALMIMSIATSKADTTTYEGFFFSVLGLSQLINRNATKGHPHSSLVSILDKQIANVRTVLQQPGTGFIGFAVLLWGAISLMMVIEQTFNQIFRVKSCRPWRRRLMLYWCVLTLVPLGLAGSIFLSDRFSKIVNSVSAGKMILAPATLIGGFAISWFVLMLLYKLIPDTLVRLRSALVGALVAGILWELGKFGFGLYVRHVAGYGKWYGNLGLIPLFMFWIYLTWNFVLVGLEITFVHQHYTTLSRRFSHGLGFLTPLVDVQCVLPLAVMLEKRFSIGGTLTVGEAARELSLPREVCQRLLDALTEAGLAYRTQRGEDRHYGLAKASENITVEHLLLAGARVCMTAADSARSLESSEVGLHAPGVIALENVQREFARTHTLAWLSAHGPLERHGSPTPPELAPAPMPA